MAVNLTPQSDQNTKQSAVPPADPFSISASHENMNKIGLTAAGHLTETSDSNSAQRGNHPQSEERKKEEEKRKEETYNLLSAAMLARDRLEREYYILQQQITKLEALEEQTREAARLLQEKSGELHDHLTKFSGARNADEFIEQRKTEIRAEIAEKLENLSKQGLSADELKVEREKLLAEEANSMAALDKAKETYKKFVVTLDEDQKRLANIDETIKAKELEIAELQSDIRQKQDKATTYAEKIENLEQQVASLKKEHEKVAEHAQETEKQFAAYAPLPPKTPEEIKLEKAMLEIKGAINGVGEISLAQLQEILDKLPQGARDQIAQKMAKENIHAVDRTPHVTSAAHIFDRVETSLLGKFSQAASRPDDLQPVLAPNLTYGGVKLGLNT